MDFFIILERAMLEITTDIPYLTPSLIYETFLLQRADPIAHCLQNLCLLELCLLIAMKRLVELETKIFNFEMIFDSYSEFAALYNIVTKVIILGL